MKAADQIVEADSPATNPQLELYAKGWAFQRYVKACKLIVHNRRRGRGHPFDKMFVPRLQKDRAELEARYPDFPEVLAEREPDTATAQELKP